LFFLKAFVLAEARAAGPFVFPRPALQPPTETPVEEKKTARKTHLLRQLRRLDRPLDHLHHPAHPVGLHQRARVPRHARRLDRVHDARARLRREQG